MEEDAKKIAARKRKAAQKTRKKRIIGWIVLSVIVVALAVGGVLLYRYDSMRTVKETMTTYQATTVREGEVSSVVSGSGTLTANHSASFTAPGDYTTVESVNYISGDAIKEGDVVMTLRCLEVEEEIDALEEELDEVLDKLASVDQEVSSLNVVAPKRGVVKDIPADVGTVADDVDYLCLLSTDGKMKVVIDKTDSMKKYDVVTVDIEGVAAEGLITEFNSDGDKATVIIEDDYYPFGETVTVSDASGNVLGKGTLDVNEYVKVNAPSGRIAAVKCVVNKSYAKGKALF